MILTNPETMRSGATFSPCRMHRYTLWREWDPSKPTLCFIGLNPSTADETLDDPTIRRCIGFARAWNFGRYEMLNLFGYRSTDPIGLLLATMKLGRDGAVAPENDAAMLSVVGRAHRVVMAWGSHRKTKELAELVTWRAGLVREWLPKLARELGHLGTNADGSPKHPLYLAAAATSFVRVSP